MDGRGAGAGARDKVLAVLQAKYGTAEEKGKSIRHAFPSIANWLAAPDDLASMRAVFDVSNTRT